MCIRDRLEELKRLGADCTVEAKAAAHEAAKRTRRGDLMNEPREMTDIRDFLHKCRLPNTTHITCTESDGTHEFLIECERDPTQTKPVDWDDDTQGVWEEKMAPFGGKFLLRVPDKDKAEKVRQSLPPGVPSRIATNGCDIFGMGAIIVMFVAISAGTLFAAYVE